MKWALYVASVRVVLGVGHRAVATQLVQYKVFFSCGQVIFFFFFLETRVLAPPNPITFLLF